jgi:hypothetical protein
METERLVSLWENSSLNHIFASMYSGSQVSDEYDLMEDAYFRTWLLSLAALANDCIEEAPDALHKTCPFTSFDDNKLLSMLVNFGDRINPFDDKGNIVNKGLLVVINALLETIELRNINSKSRCAAISYSKNTFFIIENLLSMNDDVSVIATDWLKMGITVVSGECVDGYSKRLIHYGADVNVVTSYAKIESIVTDVRNLPVTFIEVLLINDAWPDNRMYDYISAIEKLVRSKYSCTPLQRLRRMEDSESYLLPLLLKYYCIRKDVTPMDYMAKSKVPELHKQILLSMI